MNETIVYILIAVAIVFALAFFVKRAKSKSVARGPGYYDPTNSRDKVTPGKGDGSGPASRK